MRLGEELLALDEFAADEPRQRPALEDLHVHGARVVFLMILAILLQQRTELSCGTSTPQTLAVDEDVVVRHRNEPNCFP